MEVLHRLQRAQGRHLEPEPRRQPWATSAHPPVPGTSFSDSYALFAQGTPGTNERLVQRRRARLLRGKIRLAGRTHAPARRHRSERRERRPRATVGHRQLATSGLHSVGQSLISTSLPLATGFRATPRCPRRNPAASANRNAPSAGADSLAWHRGARQRCRAGVRPPSSLILNGNPVLDHGPAAGQYYDSQPRSACSNAGDVSSR